jgi:hypothetical protein
LVWESVLVSGWALASESESESEWVSELERGLESALA